MVKKKKSYPIPSVRYLYHATSEKNVPSILKKGLRTGRKPSGYGNTPVKSNVYLYHRNNRDVLSELKNILAKTEAKPSVLSIHTSGMDSDKFAADEDYYRYNAKRSRRGLKKKYDPAVYGKDYLKSLETVGLVSYSGNIEPYRIRVKKSNLKKKVFKL